MGQLIVMAGASGVGKSTFASAVYPGAMIVSSDAWREILYGDEASQRQHRLTFNMVDRETGMGLADGLTVVSDQTALSRASRERAKELATEYGVEAHLVLLRAPIEQLRSNQLARRAAGGRWVPDDVISRHLNQAEHLERLIERGKHGFSSARTVNPRDAQSVLVGGPRLLDRQAAYRATAIQAEAASLLTAIESLRHQLVEAGWGYEATTVREPETVVEPLETAERRARQADARSVADGWAAYGEAVARWRAIMDEEE